MRDTKEPSPYKVTASGALRRPHHTVQSLGRCIKHWLACPHEKATGARGAEAERGSARRPRRAAAQAELSLGTTGPELALQCRLGLLRAPVGGARCGEAVAAITLR